MQCRKRKVKHGKLVDSLEDPHCTTETIVVEILGEWLERDLSK